MAPPGKEFGILRHKDRRPDRIPKKARSTQVQTYRRNHQDRIGGCESECERCRCNHWKQNEFEELRGIRPQDRRKGERNRLEECSCFTRYGTETLFFFADWLNKDQSILEQL